MAAPKKRRTRKRRLPTAHRYPRTRTYTHAPLALTSNLNSERSITTVGFDSIKYA